jgi:signal transduction histidine kinase
VSGHGLLSWSATGGAVVLVVTVAAVLLTPGPTIDLWPVTLAFWCTVTLGSGIALVIAWRIGGWARPGRLGAGLVSLALFVSLIPRFSDLVASIDSLRDVRPLGTTVILVVAVTYLVRGVRRDDVDTSVQPVYELAASVAIMTVGVLASVTVLLLATDAVQQAIEWGPAAACLVGAVAAAVAGRHSAPVVARAVATTLFLMSVGSALHHASTGDLAQAVAAAAMCTSAVVVAGIARVRLRAALALQDARSLQTLATLGAYSTEVSRERERRHDALNALAAIRSAAEVLSSRGQSLDPATRTELSLAARAEIARVERMLALASDGGTAPGGLVSEVLQPVLLARSYRGLEVQARLGQVRVRTAPDILARIVDNLLQNVERHAPGSGVSITAEQSGGQVRLAVSDRGPGIPAQRQGHIFEPGTTTFAGGQGLGLSSARRLAQDQGGDLRLLSGERGCTFVLTLPAAPALAPASAGDPAVRGVPVEVA